VISVVCYQAMSKAPFSSIGRPALGDLDISDGTVELDLGSVPIVPPSP
jgi:hypothetical protein